MENNYFISGYTGFCPDVAQRIGQNYPDSTRDIMRERPHLRSRLGGMRWHEICNGDVNCRSGDGYECAFNAMPDYNPGYTGHAAPNAWTSCDRDDLTNNNARCPLKAYPPSCSQYGSPCLDTRCDNECCNSRLNLNYGSHACLHSTPQMDYLRKQRYSSNKPPASCCSSCSKSGLSEGDRIQYYPSNESLKSFCSSCSNGGLCEEDKNQYYPSVRRSNKPCCSSCSKGGSCEGERNQYPSNKSSKSSCYSKGGPCESDRRTEMSRPAYRRFKFRDVEVAPFRKCGVIPNYMGYIPGMQMTFGEPYGITANRLLKRHFSEQERRRH